MTLLETLIPIATNYVTDLLLENEEVKKFPKDFVTEGMKWVRSWFIRDEDPVTKTIVESAQPAAVKEVVIEAKLKDLLNNPQFVEELKAQLATYAQHNPTAKNIFEGQSLDITGSIHIGDSGIADTTTYDRKNIVGLGATIEAGGDFHLGDK